MEYVIAFLYGLEPVQNLNEQLKDIDLRDEKNNTFSVKFQAKAAQTGNFSFETKLIDSRTQEWIDGNFLKCKTNYYLMTVPSLYDEDGYHVFVFETKKLHDFVMNTKRRVVRLTDPRAIASNAGRKYDDAENLLVSVAECAAICLKKVTFRYNTVKTDEKYKNFLTKHKKSFK